MADTFEKFLQHVFSSPDLTSINEFNSEIQGFIATRMGLLSWSTEKQKQLQSQTLGMHASQHKRGARRGSEISNTSSGGTGGVSSGVGITGIGFGGLTSGICSGRNMFATRKDNIEMRFWVDEVDNYVALPSLLSLGSQGQKGNRNGPHGKDGANGDAQGSPTSHVGMDGKIANVLIAENGLVDGRSRSGSWSNGIFDAPIPHHAAHTIAQDPEFQNISRTQEPSGLLFREDKGPGDGPGRFKPPSVKTRERKQMGAGGPRRSLDQQSGVLPEPDEKSTLVPRPPHSGSLVQTVSYDYRTAGPEAVFSVAFTSALEDEFMAVGDLEEYLCYRSLNPAEPTPRLMKQEHDGPVRFVTVSNDLRLLATCGDDARLCVVDLVTKQCFLTLYHPGAVTCAAFSSNSQFVISGCADCRCRLWRTKPSTAPRELATYVGLHDRVTAIEFQSAGGLVAAGSKSGEVQMWVGSTLELVHTIGENILSSTIIGLSFNWNNEILLSADMKNILFSDVRTGAALKLLVPGDWLSPQKLRGMYENAEKPCFTAAAFAPKSLYPNYFLVGKGDCTIILYELHVEKKTDSGRSGGGSISAGNSIYANFSHGGGSSGMPQVEALEVKEVTEVWSEKLRAPPTCAFSGFSEKMILGDTNGNAIILHLESSTVIRKPPSLIGNPLREFKDVIAGKKSPPATIVLFCSQTQTYIAYGGEVQPLSVPLPPITPAALEAFIHRFGTAPSSWTSSSSSARFSSSSPSDVPLASLLSLASKLRRYLSGKDVVVVVPLSISLRRSSSSLSSRPAMPTPAHAVEGTESRLPLVSVAGSLSQGSPTSPTASLSVLSPSQHYLDYLVVFLMHPLIQVASLVVVSDVMATAIAGGCTQGVLVLHASLHCCTIGYVMDGCTTRFSACPWEEVLAGDWWEQKSGETVEEAERNWWRMRRSTTTNAWPSIEDASNEEEADANQRVDLPTATEVPGGSTRIGMGNIILEREGAGVNTVYASIRGTPSTIHEQDHGKRVFPFPTPPCIAKLTSLFGLAPIERVLGGEEGKPKNTDDFFSSSEGSSSSLIAATVPGSISQTSTTPLLGKLPLLLARLYQSYMSHQVIIVGDVLGRKGMLLLALLQAMLKAHAPGRLPSILQESHPSFASPSRSSPPPLRENSPTTPPLAPGTDRTAMNSHRSGSDNSVASHPRCNHGRTGEARDGKEEEHTEVAQQGSSTLAKKRGSKPQLSRGLDFKQGSIDSPKTKKQKMEEEEEEEEEASSERSKSSSSEEDGDTSMSSSSSLEETNTPTSWRVLPTCPPHAPWWMPLIGGSIIAQLPERDVRGMRISPSEIVETNGKIVYWKALL